MTKSSGEFLNSKPILILKQHTYFENVLICAEKNGVLYFELVCVFDNNTGMLLLVCYVCLYIILVYKTTTLNCLG